MENVGQFGIYDEVPFLDKVQRFLNQVLTLLFMNNPAVMVREIGSIIFMSVIVSRDARLHSSSREFRIALITVLIVAFAAWGRWILAEFMGPLIARLAYGSNVFGVLGGVPSRTFFTAVKGAFHIDYEFHEEDQKTVILFCGADRELVKLGLRENYEELNKERPAGAAPPPDFEEIWTRNILPIRTQVGPNRFVTYGEVIASGNIGVTVEAPRLMNVSVLVAPIIGIMQLTMVYLLARLLDGQTTLLTVIQVTLFLNLLLALVIFNYHAHQSTELPLTFLEQPGITEQLQEDINTLTGRVLRPKKITMKKGYLGLIQGYFSVLVMSAAFLNTLSTFLLVGIVLALTHFWQPAAMQAISPWYWQFSQGLLLVAAGMVLTYHAVFLILRNFKMLLAPIVSGLIVVVVPYACIYLAGGHVDFSEAKNSIIAVITGAGALLATAISSSVKKAMGSGDDDGKSKDES
jgi:hypothetical protein